MEHSAGGPPVKPKVLGPDSPAQASPLASFFRGLMPCRTPVDKAVYVLVFFGCVFYVLCESGVLRFRHLPSFSCDDTLIRKAKLPEIVPTLVLIPFVLIVPPIFLTLLELRTVGLSMDRPFNAGRVLRRYLCGLVVVVIVVQVLKEAVLEKRPHFIDACRPVRPGDRNGTLVCDYSRKGVLVTSYECTGKKGHRAFTSFPSGHACTATYSSLFVIGYLERRAVNPWTRYTLMVLWMGLGTFVSVSRIWDHMHYWWDVVVGAAMGSVFALATLTWPERL
ncbi:phospholipid phosphatase 2-like isoform X1 [Ornithodoros turicata]